MGKQALRLSKLIIFSAVLGLVFSGAAIPDIYAARVMSIALQYSGTGGLLETTDKDLVAHITTPNGDINGVTVAQDDVIVITPGPGTKNEDKGELDTETLITIDPDGIGPEVPVTLLITIPGGGEKPQVLDTNLHTSCSKTIVVDVTTVGEPSDVHSLLVVGTFVNNEGEPDGINPCDPSEEPPDIPNGGSSFPIGGTLIPIDMVSLFLTATQMNVVNYNEDFQVPSWFVTVEKWFKDGKISDSEFSKATQYLKKTNIITEIQTELKSAAIIDQIHDSNPNPEFQQKVKQYMQESGYKVDIYTTDDITVDFYKKLPSMNYEFIYIRTHSLEDLTSEQPTFLFTGEKYDIEKHTNEQQLGQIAKGSPIYEQELSEILKNKESLTDKMYFAIGSKMIDELMVGSFPQSVIIIGGCESLRSEDLATSLMYRGASTVVGWDGTINSDENDEAMLLLLEMILSGNSDIIDAARLINEKYSPDMEHHTELRIMH